MNKLQREIASNKAQLSNADDKRAQRKVLVDSLLDTVSGGVNDHLNCPLFDHEDCPVFDHIIAH